MRRGESRIRQESRSRREKTGPAGKDGCCPYAIRSDSIKAIDSTDRPVPGGGS